MKKGIFFCDIEGTITGGNLDDYKNLFANLEDLMIKDELDKLEFSLISSEDIYFVMDCYKMLKSHLEHSMISIGPMFSENIVLINNRKCACARCKVDQMLEIIKQDKHHNIYYADDTFFNHKMMNVIIKKFPSINFQSFILDTKDSSITSFFTEGKGIQELNNLLESYNLTINKNFQKIKRIN